jgi:hypothetical protein
MLSVVKRAKTLTGLLLQVIRTRWTALGRRGQMLVYAGLAVAAAVALHLGMCFFGACGGPCSLRSPCGAAQQETSAPCPYSAQRAAPVDEDAPARPCPHR